MTRLSEAPLILFGLLALGACSEEPVSEPGSPPPPVVAGGGAGGAAGVAAAGASGVGGATSAGAGGAAGALAGAGAQGGAAGTTPQAGSSGSSGAGVAGTSGSAGAAGSAGMVAAGTGGTAGAAGAAGMASSGTGGDTGAAGAGSGASWWQPTAGLTWQWQIGGGRIDPSLAVDVFDIDWEESAGVVDSLHQAGKKVICYVSVGSWEDWRPDAGDFPASVLGNDYPGWPGEKFVDIRDPALREVMARRLDACAAKGFDAVEPDNMDVFGNRSGFPLTTADGIDYATWLATESHARSLAIVQKNASEITSSIADVYDGALTEDCYADRNWCDDMQPYIDANKPVFACEYDPGIFDAACTWGTPRNYSFILKDLDLTAPVTFCP